MSPLRRFPVNEAESVVLPLWIGDDPSLEPNDVWTNEEADVTREHDWVSRIRWGQPVSGPIARLSWEGQLSLARGGQAVRSPDRQRRADAHPPGRRAAHRRTGSGGTQLHQRAGMAGNPRWLVPARGERVPPHQAAMVPGGGGDTRRARGLGRQVPAARRPVCAGIDGTRAENGAGADGRHLSRLLRFALKFLRAANGRQRLRL